MAYVRNAGLVVLAVLGQGCTRECPYTYASGGQIEKTTVAYDAAESRFLLFWTVTNGGVSGRHLATVDASGGFELLTDELQALVNEVSFAVVSGGDRHLLLSRHLVQRDSGPRSQLTDGDGVVVSNEVSWGYVEDARTSAVQSVAVPDGFLVAIARRPVFPRIPGSYALDLHRVGFDGEILSSSRIDEPVDSSGGDVPIGLAQTGDVVWVLYEDTTGTMGRRFDLQGNAVDPAEVSIAPELWLHSVASADERALVVGSTDEGARVALLDADGLGALEDRLELGVGHVVPFEGAGYLVNRTWLDLDGLPLGTLTMPQSTTGYSIAGSSSTGLLFSTDEIPGPDGVLTRAETRAFDFGGELQDPVERATESTVYVEGSMPCQLGN
jgi:hypothetical protein